MHLCFLLFNASLICCYINTLISNHWCIIFSSFFKVFLRFASILYSILKNTFYLEQLIWPRDHVMRPVSLWNCQDFFYTARRLTPIFITSWMTLECLALDLPMLREFPYTSVGVSSTESWSIFSHCQHPNLLNLFRTFHVGVVSTSGCQIHDLEPPGEYHAVDKTL